MIFSRDYIGYLARRTVKHLIDAKLITTSDLKVVEARVGWLRNFRLKTASTMKCA